jgi:tRNA threonylcarbamoyladenosine biosynthesis protein TsaB
MAFPQRAPRAARLGFDEAARFSSEILAVDTALGACSSRCCDGEEILAHIFEPMDRGHAERLAPMVDEAMKGANRIFRNSTVWPSPPDRALSPASVWDCAFMRGLRLALKRPLNGITTLEAMAAAAMAQTGHAKALRSMMRGARKPIFC